MSQNQIPQEENKNNKIDISYKVMTPSVKNTLAINLSKNLALTSVQMKNYPSSVNKLRLQENLQLKNYSNNSPKFNLLSNKVISETKSNNFEAQNTPSRNNFKSDSKNDKEELKSSKRSIKENLSSSKNKDNSLFIHQEEKHEEEINCPEQELNRPATKLTKRKFNEILNEKEEAKKSNEDLIKKINILYENYSINNEMGEINDFFQNGISDLLNLSKFLPESLCMRGSLLLESSKFSILYFHYLSYSNGTFTALNLENFVQLMDYFLMYDQNELKLLYTFFKNYILKNYTKEDIKNMIMRKEEDFQFDEVDYENQIKYLLTKKDSFVFAEAEEEAVASKKFKSKRKDISNFNFFKTDKIILLNSQPAKESKVKKVNTEKKEVIIKTDEVLNQENLQIKIEKLQLNEEEVINFSIFGEQKVNIFEIQNSSICFKHEKSINVNNFKMMDQMKFTILPTIPAEPIKELKPVRAKSSKRNDEMEISEENEEKTAENIGSSNKKNKNKSVKNKKRYQSDVKAEKKSEPVEEDEDEIIENSKPNNKTKKEKTKNKKPAEENNKKKQNEKSEEEVTIVSAKNNKKNRRGRSSNIKSNSEPESEVEVKRETRSRAAANRSKNERKTRGRSKK